MKNIEIAILVICIGLLIIAILSISLICRIEIVENKVNEFQIELDKKAIEVKPIEITAKITGYNSVPEQTDSTPCYAGSEYICGRTDVVACPRSIPKGTWVKIDGKMYECLDRLAEKHDQRFDVFCDQDFECPYKITGIKEVVIYFENQSLNPTLFNPL